MKRVLAAFALGTVALVGCGGDGPAPAPTVTVTASPDDRETFTPRQPDNQSAAEEEFVYDIQSNGMTDQLGPIPQQDVIELGYLICDSFNSGLTPEQAVEVVVGAGEVNRIDAILIVTSAAVNLCPEHTPA